MNKLEKIIQNIVSQGYDEKTADYIIKMIKKDKDLSYWISQYDDQEEYRDFCCYCGRPSRTQYEN